MRADRLHVAMLIWSYWPGHEGGAERQCRKVIPWLTERGIKIDVWTARTRWSHSRRERTLDHGIVRLGGVIPGLLSMRRRVENLLAWILPGSVGNARGQARIREALAFWIGLPPIWLARCVFLFDLWWHLRQPKNRPDIIHVHESSWLAGAAAWLARPYGIRVLAKTAVYPAWDVLGYDVPLRGLFSEARRDCQFVALAPHLADNLVDAGIPRERIFILPNGVESQPVAAVHVSGKEALFVANFSQSVEQKAFDVLLRAWSQVVAQEPAARLKLLGDGDRKPWLYLVKELGVEKSVDFLGWVSDPGDQYRRSALFVLPSRSEGISNALLEAQSWGLACVVSDIPGNRAVVEPDINGLVVPVGDAAALAIAILRLLADDRLREELGRNARQIAQDRFSLAAVAGRLDDIYRRLVCAMPVGGDK